VRQMRYLAPLMVTCAIGATTAFAAAPSGFAAAMRGLDRAVTHGKLDEIQQARAAFAALVADDPGSKQAQYGLALADWRIVPLLDPGQSDLGRKLCKEGIAGCDRVLAADPQSADALALKAGLQGLSLAYAPMAMMSLGPESSENSGRARGMAPDNPRVLLLAGISTLHTPAFAGGGAEKAKTLFERSIALYEAAGVADTSAIAWGRVDAYLWAGRCCSALKDWAGARDRYRQALAIEPEHAWIQHSLLPAAEKQLAAGSAH
jgi:tetratricopeptide (TPR) repeat protein